MTWVQYHFVLGENGFREISVVIIHLGEIPRVLAKFEKKRS